MTLPSQVYHKRFVSYARGGGGGGGKTLNELNTEICICFTNFASLKVLYFDYLTHSFIGNSLYYR